MLSLEGELSASLSQAGALAQALGARVGASKTVVMQRYKTIYDLVEEYIRDVPWLEAHQKTGRGRSKVAKRVVVARGLKDVVQFQEDIWRKKLEAQARPVFDIEVDSSADGEDDDSVDARELSDVASVASRTSGGHTQDAGPSAGPSQRKKVRQTPHERAVEQASKFLLAPLASGAPTSIIKGDKKTPPAGELLEHFLVADEFALSHAFAHPPTRLQVLAASRGEDAVADEDLFDEGELEGLLRTQAEVEILRKTFDWEVPDQDSTETDVPKRSKKRKRDDTQAGNVQSSPERHSKRINMDVLARLMDPNTNLDDIHEDEDFSALGLGLGLEEQGDDGDSDSDEPATYAITGGDDEEVGEWRPMSPGGGMFDEDRYDA